MICDGLRCFSNSKLGGNFQFLRIVWQGFIVFHVFQRSIEITVTLCFPFSHEEDFFYALLIDMIRMFLLTGQLLSTGPTLL